MTSLNSMFRRLDRVAASGQEPPGERPVVLVLAPPGLSSHEADRLRELVGLTRRKPAEEAELNDLLRRAPEVEARLEGARSALLLYVSERELRL